MDGAFFNLPWGSVLIMAAGAWMLMLLRASLDGGRWELLGLASFTAAASAGVWFLVNQRVDAGVAAWGYYPAKFCWIAAMLLPLLAARAVVGTGRSARPDAFPQLATGLAVILAGVTLMAQIPPADSRPYSLGNPAPRPAPDWRLSSVLPVGSLSVPHGNSELDPAAEALMAASDPADKVIFAWYHKDGSFDAFINFWLLQQPVDSGNEMPRPFAYVLDNKSVEAVCHAASSWGGGVTVHSRRPKFARALEKACPAAVADVVLGSVTA
jgi:hypothetical protein